MPTDLDEDDEADDEGSVGTVELGRAVGSVGSEGAEEPDGAVRYVVSDGSEIRRVRRIRARMSGEMIGDASRSVGSAQIGSGSLTVPMVLTWKRMLPKARSNPSWKDPNTRRCAGVCGVNTAELRKIRSARMDGLVVDEVMTGVVVVDEVGAGEFIAPPCVLPTDGAN